MLISMSKFYDSESLERVGTTIHLAKKGKKSCGYTCKNRDLVTNEKSASDRNLCGACHTLMQKNPETLGELLDHLTSINCLPLKERACKEKNVEACKPGIEKYPRAVDGKKFPNGLLRYLAFSDLCDTHGPI